MTSIRNGWLAVDGELIIGDLHICEGRLTEEACGGEVMDASGMIVAPGLIDVQINGGFGRDFTQDPTTIWEVGARLPEFGVTSFVPTIVTSPVEVTDRALEVVAYERPDDYVGAEVLGLHFEGPWISPEKEGAHNRSHIVDPDPVMARRWAETGLVSIVTLAPEMPGATEVAEILQTSGVVVSIGHSAATYDVARRSLAGSATMVTHLFNQMSPLTHHDPGVVGASLLSEHPVGLIIDGLHISDGALELAWRLLGHDRVILVTDAMAALGLGPGTYQLGDGPVTVADDGPRTADGRLAGSIVTLPQAIANLIRVTGTSRARALLGATSNPARALGLGDRGHLNPGGRADLIVTDMDLNPVMTLIAGEIIET